MLFNLDLTRLLGQIMLASWRGARLEVIQVLREVVNNVLKEPGQPDIVLYNRAKVSIFSSSSPLG